MNKKTQHIDNKSTSHKKGLLPELLIKLFKESEQNYFDNLVQFLCTEANVDYAFIGEYLPDENAIVTRSFLAHGEKVNGYKYSLKSTPCENVVGTSYCIYPKDVQHLFPKDEDLKKFGIEGYAGVPLFDVNKSPLGIIVLMSNSPLKKEKRIELLLDLVKGKTGLELERILLSKAFVLSQKDFVNAFENFQDVFFWVNYNNKNEQIGTILSPSIEKILKYTREELRHLNFNDIYANVEERHLLMTTLQKKGNVKNYFITFVSKHNKKVYTEVDAELITKGLPEGSSFAIRGVIKDVTKRHYENLRTEIAYLIAEKSQRRLINLNSLGEFIHFTLKEVIPISNLYIATINFEEKLTQFPYFKDEHYKKKVTEFSRPYNKNGFTEYIIQNKKVIVANKQELRCLATSHELELIGRLPEKLVAIPLKSDGISLGVLVAQCYDSGCSLSEEDFELLRFIASQIAVIIDRKNWQDKLIKNEEYFRSLVENSSEIICILNKNGTIDYISESCKRIIGYLPHEIIGKPISNFISINNPEAIIENKIKHPNIKEIEVLKVYGKNNNKVYLELSISNFLDENQLIINAKDVTHKVIENKEKKLAQKKLQSIHNIEKALISEKPLDQVLANALKIISDTIFSADRLSVSLIENNTLEIVGLYTKIKKNIKPTVGDKFLLNSLPSYNNVIKQKSFYQKDLRKAKVKQFFDQQNIDKEILSYYVMPLIVKNKLVGTLNLGSKTAHHFDNIEKSIIQEISTLLAIVLKNAILKRNLITRENDLSTIFNYSKEGILKIDNVGNIVFANKSICDWLGYKEKDLCKLNYFDITYTKDIELCKTTFSYLTNNIVPEHSAEKRFISKNNNILDCELNINSVYKSTQELDYCVIFIKDITTQKTALKKINDLQNAINYSTLVMFVDSKARITSTNKRFQELTGFSEKELIGKSPNILNSNYHTKEFWATLWSTITSGNIWQGEIRNQTKNGEIYWILATITPILNSEGKIEQYIAIQSEITKEKNAKTTLIKEVIEAQERERERFAMEIHDGLGQVLLASKMNLNAIEDEVGKLDIGTKDIYDKSMELLNNAAQEARNISHGLMSRVLTKFGLSHAINEIVTNINSSKKLKISFSSNIDETRFNEDLEMGLYRTLQELINNVIKHSQASNAFISIRKIDNKLLVQIKDNGIGITKGNELNPSSTGIGLRNMKSRIEYLGGTLVIDENIKKGTKINIELAI